MSCYSRFTQNVQACGGVRATKGIEPRIFVAPHGTLQYDDATENKLTNPLFSTVINNWVEVEGYKNTFNCGSDEVVSEIVGAGFKHYISFMYNGINAEIDKVDNITVVVIRGGILEVYGLKNGLWKSSQSKKASDNNGLSTVEFISLEGREEDYSCHLFDNGVDNLSLLSTQLGITGLIIPISTNATFTYEPITAPVKLILSDGTIFTGVNGTVTFSTAIAQGATVVADETVTLINISELGITGNIISSTSNSLQCYQNNISSIHSAKNSSIELNNNTNCNSVYAPSITMFLLASGCALTAKSIGDQLLAFLANNPTASGEADFRGVTNAYETEIIDYFNNMNVQNDGVLRNWIAANLPGWTIIFNE